MPATPAPHTPLADFTLPGGVLTDDGFEHGAYTLSSRRGRPLVLAFYPGDDTSVCTKQLCSYSSGLDVFADSGAEVWGISPQGLDSHESFARKHGLRMPLLADTDRSVAKSFGITAPGIGLRRAVFIVAPDGTLHWKHVSLLGATFQTTDVLARELRSLTASS
ncbi:peroxiredoxin [Streptomyces sp. NBC_00237]|uniref:peroxiredoxin n=1 Tax=Streptomyces sp. NBC_00237 TaxID=2975687 RepID=UPI00224D11C7|nr:peroxiredoxin [Streptomyces sp. NBC_00237]MCX5202761.1 peroxiredoxin [Streptomyces sp. NBC_00237]